MSVAAWLAYASRAHASARCVAKLDDDAYIYTPGLEVLMHQALNVAPTPEALYMGPMSWFHWYEKIYERSGFGWTYTMAWHLGRSCRNVTESELRCKGRGCGGCVGPFPFSSGYLSILATPLAAEVASSATLIADVERLATIDSLPTRTGGKQPKIMEDIWMGSLLYRRPPSRPLSYVALSEGNDPALVSDGWGLKVSKSSVVVHVKNHQTGKQLERFLATHAFKQASHCVEHYAVRCTRGCTAFFSAGENETLLRSERFGNLWRSRLGNSSLCSGSQAEAAFCRVTLERPRLCPHKPKDLLNDDAHLLQTHSHAQQLLETLRVAKESLQS